jgi:hypothetical protein
VRRWYCHVILPPYEKFYFDIETIPADDSSHEALQYLYDRKLAKKMKDKKLDKETALAEIGSFEQFVDSTGFDGSFGTRTLHFICRKR